MSLFTTEEQTTAYQRDPNYYKGSGFILGLMGYKKNGQKNTFGKIKDVAMPILGGVVGAAIGGPAGAAIGASLGQAGNAAGNRSAMKMVGGAEDTQEAIDNDLTNTMARGQLGVSLAGLAGGAIGGAVAGNSGADILKTLGSEVKEGLPNLASGLAGAIGANATPTMPVSKRVRYFATGGEARPAKASPGFAAAFRQERDRQGAGGLFQYQGKAYTTNFAEEVDSSGKLLSDVMGSTGSVDLSNMDLGRIQRKRGVNLDGLNPVLASYINTLPEQLRRGVVITSGLDSAKIHNPKSKHKHGNAIDLRFNGDLFEYIKGDPLAAQLGLRTLDPNHGTAPHIHLEYSGRRFATGGPVTPRRIGAANRSMASESTGVNRPVVANRLLSTINLPVDTVAETYAAEPYFVNQDKSKIKKAIQTNSSPERVARLRKELDEDKQVMEREKMGIRAVSYVSGRPQVHDLDEDEGSVFARLKGKDRAYYNSDGVHVRFENPADYIAEASHAIQSKHTPGDVIDPLSFIQHGLGVVSDNMKKAPYLRPGSLEFQAHEYYEPKLQRIYDWYGDKPKNEKKLMSIGKTQSGRTFKNGGESFRPFSFKYGGLSFNVDKPKDYKVYADNDDTEDIVMHDRKTGKYYGQMRYGEKIFDQQSSLIMNGIMDSDATPSQKRLALGQHIHDELLTHPKESDYSFATGGPVKPRPKRRYDPAKVMSDFRKHNERLVDKYKREGAAQNNPYFRTDGDRKAAQIAQGAQETLDAIDRGEVTYDPSTNALVNKRANRRYDLNRLGGLHNETGFATNYGAGIVYMGSNPKYGNVAPGTPAPAAAASPATPSPTMPAPSAAKTGQAQTRVSTRTRSSKTTTTSVRRGTPPPVVTPGAAVNANLAKLQATPAGKLAANWKYTPPAVDTNPVPQQPAATLPPIKITDQVVAAVEGKQPAAATSWLPKPVTTDATKKPDYSQLMGTVGDLGRIATGAIMASRQVPAYAPSSRFTNWQAEVESRKNQGYTAPEWNTINGQIADNYGAGVNAITNTMGGGANPGAVLAGLTRIGQQRGQQTQAAAVGDAARRQQNFLQYGAMVNQDLGLDRQLYEDRVQPIIASQLAGVALANAGLQNISQRNLFEQNYGPDSLYSKLLNSQQKREEENTELLKTMRQKVLNS